MSFPNALGTACGRRRVGVEYAARQKTARIRFVLTSQAAPSRPIVLQVSLET